MKFICKASSPASAEMRMYSSFGERYGGISPSMVMAALDQLSSSVKQINIYIDSDGGVVDEGVAIHNILKRHKAKKRVIVDGLAASIATYVALAGDTIVMTSNSQWMIHKAWGVFAGDDDAFLAAAQGLRNATEIIRDAYAAKTGMSPAQAYELMKAETWMKADRAKALGFIDEIEQMTEPIGARVGSYTQLNSYRNVPDDLRSPNTNTSTLLARMHMRTQQLNRRTAGAPA